MEQQCKYCGAAINQIPKQKPKKFCSDQCRFKWWNEHRDEMESRDIPIKECEHCGIKFSGTKDQKYCSHEHYITARFGMNPMAATLPKLPILYIRNENDPEPILIQAYETIKPQMLEGETETLQMRRVFLVSGLSNFQGKYDHYARIVPEIMMQNMMQGDAFVFCNRSHSQLSILQWQGDGFALYFKRTEYSRFPWPSTRQAQVVEITPEDLKMLMESPRLQMRISGIKTPQVLV